MAKIAVRRATMQDTSAISQLFRKQIKVWQRINAEGQVEDLPYDALSIYERWLHGGAWMSIETSAILLSHLLCGAGVPLIAETDGVVRAYAEIYPGDEPEPFGRHWHLSHLITGREYGEKALLNALLQFMVEQARQDDIERVTVSISGYDNDAATFYSQFGMIPLHDVVRVGISAQTGQGFYKVTPYVEGEPAKIQGWHMDIGRTESARHHWETLWANLWGAFSEVASRQTDRLRVIAAGQEVFLCCQQDLYDPRTADIYCWSPKNLTPQIMVAVRDWAHRQGYRTLHLNLAPQMISVLKLEAETVPYKQVIYALDV